MAAGDTSTRAQQCWMLAVAWIAAAPARGVTGAAASSSSSVDGHPATVAPGAGAGTVLPPPPDSRSSDSRPACVCDAAWVSPGDGGTCGSTQRGCPSSACDDDPAGEWVYDPWCMVANPGCATEEQFGGGGWAYCEPELPGLGGGKGVGGNGDGGSDDGGGSADGPDPTDGMGWWRGSGGGVVEGCGLGRASWLAPGEVLSGGARSSIFLVSAAP